jgi:cytochrome c553
MPGAGGRTGLAAMVAALALAGVARAAPVEERLAPCLACHGAAGLSTTPETPSLGGQPSFFVIAQLFLFREGRRDSVLMNGLAKDLTNDDLRAFAERISKLPPPPPPPGPPDPASFARGRALAGRRPCPVCHNPDFSGREQVPRLANQREDYLLKAMREYQSGARIGYGGTMLEELKGLSEGDLRDLAHFLAHLPRP